MSNPRHPAMVLAAAFMLYSGAAGAHATLERQEAPSGALYKAVIKIGHGCAGSPTLSVRVQVPEGVIAAKPMPKPGWELKTVVGPYAKAYEFFHGSLSSGVKEITWSGGNLPDAWYDEFVFTAKLPDAAPGTKIYFPVVQECEKGVHRWIEIPEAGKSAGDLKEPAPSLTLTPKAGH